MKRSDTSLRHLQFIYRSGEEINTATNEVSDIVAEAAGIVQQNNSNINNSATSNNLVTSDSGPQNLDPSIYHHNTLQYGNMK